MMLAFVKRLGLGQPEVRASGSVVAVQPVLSAVDVARLSFIGGAGGAGSTGRALSTMAENVLDGTLGVVATAGMMACQLLVDIKVLESVDDGSRIGLVMEHFAAGCCFSTTLYTPWRCGHTLRSRARHWRLPGKTQGFE